MIVITNYNMGNLASIRNMLKKVGVDAVVSSDPQVIRKATGLILPGVGHFDRGMEQLMALDLVPVLQCKVLEEKTPVLGICLGMQLLTRRSEEGQRLGLGWLDAETVRFRFEDTPQTLKVPHMGWNTTSPTRDDSLFEGLMNGRTRFYFVHSYHVVCAHEADVLAYTHHGVPFAASVQHEHIMGTQFHPEKSHRYGMRLLKNFVEFC